MRIEFKQNFQGKILEPHVSADRNDAYTKEDPRSKVIPTIYNYESLNQTLATSLEAGLKESGHECVISGSSIWSPAPTPFAVRLNSHRAYGKRHAVHLEKEQWRKIGTELFLKKRFFGENTKSDIPVYQEIPSVSVEGIVAYENLEGVDPSSEIRVLTGLGYQASVITTPEELQDAVERAKRIQMQRAASGSRRSSSSSGMGSDSTGMIAGMAIGGASGGISGAVIGGMIGSFFDD